MKIRTIAIPFCTFLLGGFIVAALFLERVIPGMNYQIDSDVQYIKLDNGDKPYPYNDFLSEVHMARLYLRSPWYFYKKNLGYKMLEGFAKNGYTPAAISIDSYHVNRMLHFLRKGDTEKVKEHFDKSYDLSKLAAEQGDDRPLMMFVKNNPTSLPQEHLAEDLEILDKWAENSTGSAAALMMSEYYQAHGNKEKAKKFEVLYEERMKNPKPAPACTTITPWRGL